MPLVSELPPVQMLALFTWVTRLSEVACAGRTKVGVDGPAEPLVIAAAVGPQLNSMLSGTPVIIPIVSRVSVAHADEMTGRVPLGVAGKVGWNNVTP